MKKVRTRASCASPAITQRAHLAELHGVVRGDALEGLDAARVQRERAEVDGEVGRQHVLRRRASTGRTGGIAVRAVWRERRERGMRVKSLSL